MIINFHISLVILLRLHRGLTIPESTTPMETLWPSILLEVTDGGGSKIVGRNREGSSFPRLVGTSGAEAGIRGATEV